MKKLLLLLLVILLPQLVLAQTLKVGVVSGAPIAFQDITQQWHGIAIDAWDAVATTNHWQYQLVPMGENVKQAIDKLHSGAVDVLIGPVQINSQTIKTVDFSQPFFLFNISIAEAHNPAHFLKILYTLLAGIFGGFFSLGILVLFILSNIWWLAERKHLSQRRQNYFYGVMFYFWYSLVMLFTLNYTDAPKAVISRIVLLCTAIVCALFASVVISSITSALTTSLSTTAKERIATIQDISGKTFAGLKGGAGIDIIRDYAGNVIETDTLNQAFNLLADKKVDGVVDSDILLEFELQRPEFTNFHVSPMIVTVDSYAFAFRSDNTFRQATNLALIKLQDANKIYAICLKYLDEKNAKACIL